MSAVTTFLGVKQNADNKLFSVEMEAQRRADAIQQMHEQQAFQTAAQTAAQTFQAGEAEKARITQADIAKKGLAADTLKTNLAWLGTLSADNVSMIARVSAANGWKPSDPDYRSKIDSVVGKPVPGMGKPTATPSLKDYVTPGNSAAPTPAPKPVQPTPAQPWVEAPWNAKTAPSAGSMPQAPWQAPQAQPAPIAQPAPTPAAQPESLGGYAGTVAPEPDAPIFQYEYTKDAYQNLLETQAKQKAIENWVDPKNIPYYANNLGALDAIVANAETLWGKGVLTKQMLMTNLSAADTAKIEQSHAQILDRQRKYDLSLRQFAQKAANDSGKLGVAWANARTAAARGAVYATYATDMVDIHRQNTQLGRQTLLEKLQTDYNNAYKIGYDKKGNAKIDGMDEEKQAAIKAQMDALQATPVKTSDGGGGSTTGGSSTDSRRTALARYQATLPAGSKDAARVNRILNSWGSISEADKNNYAARVGWGK